LKWFLIFYQLQGPRIAPANAGRVGGNTAEIALKGKAGLGLYEKRFLWARSPAEHTHIVCLITHLYSKLRCASRIHKGTGNHGKEYVPLLKNPDSGPSRIGNARHMIQRTGYLAMPAAGAFVVINHYLRHDYPSILRTVINDASRNSVLYRVWAVIQVNSKYEYRKPYCSQGVSRKQIRIFKFPNASNYKAADLF
jgi:hypothetical protein